MKIVSNRNKKAQIILRIPQSLPQNNSEIDLQTEEMSIEIPKKRYKSAGKKSMS